MDDDEDEDNQLYSQQAQEIAEDPGVDDGTAMRRLMTIQIDLMENMMVSLWDISDALKLRTKGKDINHDA